MVKQSNYSVYYKTTWGEVIKCAAIQLVENDIRQLVQVAFTYHNDFLDAKLPSIDPFHLPLSNGLIILNCDREAPGFIDDLMPDKWGKTVLSRLHNFGHQMQPCISEILNVLGDSTIGALSVVPLGEPPKPYGFGCNKTNINQLQTAAFKLGESSLTDEEVELYKLSMFARGSSAVGGARPKVMVHDKNEAHIAKFAKNEDQFSYARVEKSCLDVIASAGFNVSGSFVESVDGKDVLFSKRFDLSLNQQTQNLTALKQQGRYHQSTMNAFLKEPETQRDLAYSGYDKFVKVISKISINPAKDNQQIFAQMLFNVVFNNTDDHLRNFSFNCNEHGWFLSPAYDVVPSLAFGQYHQSRLGYSDFLPRLNDAEKHHKLFNLSKPVATNIINRIKEAVAEMNIIFDDNGVSNTDWATVNKTFKQA